MKNMKEKSTLGVYFVEEFCYNLGTLSYLPYHCNSFEVRLTLDRIYALPTFKWVASTWFNESAHVSSSKDNQSDMAYPVSVVVV